MLGQAKFQMQTLVSNPVFLSLVFSWFSAQFIKTLIKLLSGKVHSLKELIELMFWKTGGMPSSHTALVMSLCVSIGFRNGVTSDIFILSVAFAIVVVRDAVGVRRSSGLQTKALNELSLQLKSKGIIDDFVPLKEIHGHKPAEVIMGCFLGVFIGIAFSVL
ncbi:MAG: divergent PAP2 family protein [Treponemataceae bacterium]|nr:divergent PAP2 family protein [Treponemataceae bacterium]